MNEINNTLDESLMARKYDPNKHPPAEQITMLIQSQTIGALQNFITVTGVEKAGKGKFIASMTAAAITNTEIFGIRIRAAENRRRVALFDTEQSDYHFYKSMATIKKIAGIDTFPQNFDAYCMREDEPDTRIKLIENYLFKNPDCSIIMLDGLLDLTYSMNDETQCSRLIQKIMYWTKAYNCFIVAVLHRSKLSGTTIGHLGSFANRKAQSVLLVEKDKDTGQILLKPEYLRDSSGFESIAIHYDKHNHNWVEAIPETPAANGQGNNGRERKRKPQDFDISEHRAIVSQIFNSQSLQTYKELTGNICQLYGAGKNWAVDCVPHLLSENLIYKVGPGEYTNQKKIGLTIAN